VYKLVYAHQLIEMGLREKALKYLEHAFDSLRAAGKGAVYPKPETLQPCISRPETRNPAPRTRNPKPKTRNLKPDTRNSKPETRNPKPETRNPKPEPET